MVWYGPGIRPRKNSSGTLTLCRRQANKRRKVWSSQTTKKMKRKIRLILPEEGKAAYPIKLSSIKTKTVMRNQKDPNRIRTRSKIA